MLVAAAAFGKQGANTIMKSEIERGRLPRHRPMLG